MGFFERRDGVQLEFIEMKGRAENHLTGGGKQ
jgi:hypothetical protein